MNDELPEVSVSPVRKVFLSGASVVWVIPLLALAAALAVAWQSFNDRGPLVLIDFEKGAGIKASETELRYRDVTVGVVEKVGFTEGLEKVTAHVRVDKEVAPFIDSSAVFWIVQPEVSARGITGLSTVLSGVYIEGSWDEVPGTARDRYQGSSQAPLIRPGQGGLEIAFRTVANGQLTDDAPILYRGIEVGRVGRASIAPRGNFAIVEAIIFEEHRGLINQSTRFWDTSGFSVKIGPSGAEIDFSSLATLVGGGVTFDTFVSGGDLVQDGAIFEVFPDKETARNSLFNQSEVAPLEISVVFDDNISGLTVGAPVELSGFTIGEVSAISGIVDSNQFGDSRVRLNANLTIQPARLGLPGDVSAVNALTFLQSRVADGLRARLSSASLLTGGLKVEFVLVPDAQPATLTSPDGGLPVMPTTFNETTDAAATVEGVFTRINNLPIEELLNSAITFLDSAEAFVSSEDLQEAPTDVRALLAEVQGLVASDDVRNIPVALNEVLQRVEGLVTELEEEQFVARLSVLIDRAAIAAGAVEVTLAGVPDLVAQIDALAEKAENLALEDLIAEVTKLTRSADALLSSEATAALPAELQSVLSEVNAVLGELKAGGAVDNLSSILASTRGTAAALERDFPTIVANLSRTLEDASSAATAVEASVAGVPQLVTQIEAVAANLETLEVDELINELAELTRSAEAVIGTDDAVALPGALRRALDEVNATLAELRRGGAVDNVNQTLASARNAADSIAISTRDLPQIVDRLTALFDQAGRTIQGYNRGDEVSRSVLAALRDIQKAAEALESLARTIERNPNSLLL
ncbi:MAG: MlaD family protein, partial [Pseudomonadota bacterium]